MATFICHFLLNFFEEFEWFDDEQSELNDRAKRGNLPQGLDSNPAVGRMIKLVILNRRNIRRLGQDSEAATIDN